jgi:hypothetical protein
MLVPLTVTRGAAGADWRDEDALTIRQLGQIHFLKPRIGVNSGLIKLRTGHLKELFLKASSF